VTAQTAFGENRGHASIEVALLAVGPLGRECGSGDREQTKVKAGSIHFRLLPTPN
jgi:hypothetical protein